jgi:hypothetical protein
MEKELANHTKKIYETVKDPREGFWHKMKEVGIEIFIIVFAVTLSIWLHNWSDHRHEQQETKEFLRGLKDDLTKDTLLMKSNRADFVKVDSNFWFLRTLYTSKAIDTASDRLITHHLDFEMRATHANIGRYEGFKSSGRIGTIEDDSLKQAILVYYQQTMPDLVDDEGIANSFQSQILDLEVSKRDEMSMRDLARSFKMQALLEFATGNLEGVIRDYDSARLQARKIIAMIGPK